MADPDTGGNSQEHNHPSRRGDLHFGRDPGFQEVRSSSSAFPFLFSICSGFPSLPLYHFCYRDDYYLHPEEVGFPLRLLVDVGIPYVPPLFPPRPSVFYSPFRSCEG